MSRSTSRSPGTIDISTDDLNYVLKKITKAGFDVEVIWTDYHYNHKKKVDPHHWILKMEVYDSLGGKTSKTILGMIIPIWYKSVLDLRRFLTTECVALLERYMHEKELMGEDGLPKSTEKDLANAAEATSPATMPGPSKSEDGS